MAGRLDKLIIVKPQTIPTNFKSLSQLFFTPGELATALLNGRIVTSVQTFACAFCNKILILQKQNQKKKKAHFLSNSLAQIWLEIWHYLTLRNSPQWKNIHRKCVSTHVNTLKMHNAHLYQQSNSWWRMLWLRNDLLHESNLIPQNFLESQSEGDAKRPVSFWLSVQSRT